MSIESDIQGLIASVSELYGLLAQQKSEEVGFREFAIAGIMLDIKELKEKVGLEWDDVDKPDPLEPVVNESSGIGFTGVAYVSGRRISGLLSNSAYPWVKIDASAGTATEVAGPPGSPFPPNEEWYEKSKVAGDIHLTRL